MLPTTLQPVMTRSLAATTMSNPTTWGRLSILMGVVASRTGVGVRPLSTISHSSIHCLDGGPAGGMLVTTIAWPPAVSGQRAPAGTKLVSNRHRSVSAPGARHERQRTPHCRIASEHAPDHINAPRVAEHAPCHEVSMVVAERCVDYLSNSPVRNSKCSAIRKSVPAVGGLALAAQP